MNNKLFDTVNCDRCLPKSDRTRQKLILYNPCDGEIEELSLLESFSLSDVYDGLRLRISSRY